MQCLLILTLTFARSPAFYTAESHISKSLLVPSCAALFFRVPRMEFTHTLLCFFLKLSWYLSWSGTDQSLFQGAWTWDLDFMGVKLIPSHLMNHFGPQRSHFHHQAPDVGVTERSSKNSLIGRFWVLDLDQGFLKEEFLWASINPTSCTLLGNNIFCFVVSSDICRKNAATLRCQWYMY